jgi:hypothetical protein
MQNAMPMCLLQNDFSRASISAQCCNKTLTKNSLQRAQERAHGRASIHAMLHMVRERAC